MADEHHTTRRALLAGAGSAGLLAVLCTGTGCGKQSAAGAGPAGAASPTPAANPTAAPSPTTAPGFLASAADIPVGGGKVLARERVLLVQPAAGTIKAFDARCPHQGTILPEPDSSGVITCQGHYAQFRAADGSLLGGPSPSALVPIAVKVTDGQVLRA
jgi:nitrite reductase/ring-hydroxylating ferredoxin subunit